MSGSKLAIGLILALAAGLRVVGLDFDPHHPDERWVTGPAQRMLERGSFDPGPMAHGHLAPYLQAAALAPARSVRSGLGLEAWSPDEELLVGRALSAVAGTLTVLLTALLARELLRGGKARGHPIARTALVAALLQAVAFVSVQCSHYATVDTLMAALTTGATLLALQAHATGALSRFVAAGALVGLAAATKYTGALAALPLLAIPLVSPPGRRRIGRTALALLAVPVGFGVGMPYALLAPERLLAATWGQARQYGDAEVVIFAAGPDTGWWIVDYLGVTGIGPACFGLAAFGLGWMALRAARGAEAPPARGRSLLFLVYPVLLMAFLSRFPTRFDRNLLPLVPFASVLAAWLLGELWQRVAARRPARALLLALLALAVAHPLCRVLVFDLQLRSPHTRTRLAAWQAALPEGTKVAGHKRFQRRSFAQLQAEGFDYVVLSSQSVDPVRLHPERYPELAQRYAEIEAHCEPAVEFRHPWFGSEFFAPRRLLNSATVNLYHGPTLTVLRVPRSDGAR